GLTLPLVTKADGSKFGKTESGAVWLDAKKTSPYAFYQFWLNGADADVYRFLRYFTFLSVDEIDAIEAADREAGGKPEAQRILAERATELVYGKAALEAARRISLSLFSGSVETLTESDFEQLAQDGVPGARLGKAASGLIEALVAAGLAKSKSEARGFLQSGSVMVNGIRVEALDHRIQDAERRFGRYTLLRRGRKNYALLDWR
ncbi:MAG: tyrosine--tRNA ligase, partial [Candidatus Accumulibacter sp.]|nr:tyrosine--tRNA ligase [Accumulibacter sp.]